MIIINRMNIRSKLLIMLLLISICSILVIGYLGLSSSQAALTNAIFDQLTSVRATKAYQIETYFDGIHHHISTLSEDRMMIDAMQTFNMAYAQLNAQTIPPSWDHAIDEYYKTNFLGRTVENDTGYSAILPDTIAARYLQYHYIADNPYQINLKARLKNPGDGSVYSNAHAKYHAVLYNLTKKFGYHDLFLIDIERANIIYTVSKETDFATSLVDGPYAKSNLAQVVQSVREHPYHNRVETIDFALYPPSYGQPVAFMASTIYDINGGVAVGILVLQLPVDEINNIMTGHQNWQRDSLGESGESYLVGQDRVRRSVSRFLIEDHDNHPDRLRSQATSTDLAAQIKEQNTSILLQKVDTVGVRAAIEGNADTQIIKNYRDVDVLSSYAPLDIEGLHWAVLAEMDLTEAYRPIYALQYRYGISTGLLIGFVILLAWLLAHLFTRPVNMLTKAVQKVEEGQYDVEINLETQDEFGLLLNAFNRMAQSIRSNITDLGRANDEISALNEQLKNENLYLNAELEVTRRLQEMILPNQDELYNVQGLDIAGYMEPANQVGGDYYDVLSENGSVKIGIGDVTDHGLESGVVMLMTQTAVRTLLNSGESDPIRFLDILNRTVYGNLQRMNTGHSLTLALLDYEQNTEGTSVGGKICLSGQHEEVIVMRQGKGHIEVIDTIDLGFPIGLDDDVARFFNRVTVELASGDGIVLFTDGITEAENLIGDHYGMERLCQMVSQHWSGSANAIKEAIIADVWLHIGKQEVFDDITLVVAKQE